MSHTLPMLVLAVVAYLIAIPLSPGGDLYSMLLFMGAILAIAIPAYFWGWRRGASRT